ncbi:DUF4834 domain-containing protein [Robiginitalea sp. SC105]|uniref:DUF4834 domain-containing protein n=1 Tax=Robiginitalea sp. SC105 TaxID=2762332 RepID=UPI00163B566F|nr:DUF4834 domain-containing protein [Robiginitalea sp. SC105]MBC2840673.1 DUF4834 domain-containing protein [Robiginitalea sp. SC105]
MGILKVLLFLLLGYYFLMILGRLLGPWLRSYASRKTEEYFREAFNQAPPAGRDVNRTGEVTIDRKPQKEQRSGEPVGEYIEYEEID